MPMAVTSSVNEMIAGGCLALQLAPLMSQGQIEALDHHASDELKAIYLPKLVAGEWNATMNLTEAQAGSDVGAIRSRAEPNGDGTYAVTGQKIYISWGDNDFTENTVHLVLARLPDAPKGTKGISLFLVPKRLPDAEGNAGVANALKVVSLEHKLGLHGSPTCVMQYDGATGWLVGEEHGGMAAMFTMMNNARLGVGVHALGAGEAAYQHALAYAQDRVQGRAGFRRDRDDPRPRRCAADADRHEGRYLRLPRAVAGPRGVDRHGDRDGRSGLDRTRRVPDADREELRRRNGAVGRRYGDPGAWRHGLHRGNRRRAIRPRRARVGDLRGHDRHPGGGPRGPQAVGWRGGGLRPARRGAETAERADSDALSRNRRGAARTTRKLLAMELNDRLSGSVPYARAIALTLGGHYHAQGRLGRPGWTPREAGGELPRVARWRRCPGC
jgi:acyl-CoA dehydrogenase